MFLILLKAPLVLSLARLCWWWSALPICHVHSCSLLGCVLMGIFYLWMRSLRWFWDFLFPFLYVFLSTRRRVSFLIGVLLDVLVRHGYLWSYYAISWLIMGPSWRYVGNFFNFFSKLRQHIYIFVHLKYVGRTPWSIYRHRMSWTPPNLCQFSDPVSFITCLVLLPFRISRISSRPSMTAELRPAASSLSLASCRFPFVKNQWWFLCNGIDVRYVRICVREEERREKRTQDK